MYFLTFYYFFIYQNPKSLCFSHSLQNSFIHAYLLGYFSFAKARYFGTKPNFHQIWLGSKVRFFHIRRASAKLFNNSTDLTRRYAIYHHLHNGKLKSSFASVVSFKQLSKKSAVAKLGNVQLKNTKSSGELTGSIPISLSGAIIASLIRFCANLLGCFRL